jgi:Sec-independent protein secretion pathway component TatC
MFTVLNYASLFFTVPSLCRFSRTVKKTRKITLKEKRRVCRVAVVVVVCVCVTVPLFCICV